MITFQFLEQRTADDESDSSDASGHDSGPRSQSVASGADSRHPGHRSVDHRQITPIIPPKWQKAVEEEGSEGAAAASQQSVERCVSDDDPVSRFAQRQLRGRVETQEAENEKQSPQSDKLRNIKSKKLHNENKKRRRNYRTGKEWPGMCWP